VRGQACGDRRAGWRLQRQQEMEQGLGDDGRVPRLRGSRRLPPLTLSRVGHRPGCARRELRRAPRVGDGRGGAVLGRAAMTGWARPGAFVAKSVWAPAHPGHCSPRSHRPTRLGPRGGHREPVPKELRVKQIKGKKKEKNLQKKKVP